MRDGGWAEMEGKKGAVISSLVGAWGRRLGPPRPRRLKKDVFIFGNRIGVGPDPGAFGLGCAPSPFFLRGTVGQSC